MEKSKKTITELNRIGITIDGYEFNARMEHFVHYDPICHWDADDAIDIHRWMVDCSSLDWDNFQAMAGKKELTKNQLKKRLETAVKSDKMEKAINGKYGSLKIEYKTSTGRFNSVAPENIYEFLNDAAKYQKCQIEDCVRDLQKEHEIRTGNDWYDFIRLQQPEMKNEIDHVVSPGTLRMDLITETGYDVYDQNMVN